LCNDDKMMLKKTLKGIVKKIKTLWDRQPEIIIYQPLPKISPEPEPFELKGHIIRSDDSARKITKSGNSYHVTFPPEWLQVLNVNIEYSALFHAQGKVGLIFVCEGRRSD